MPFPPPLLPWRQLNYEYQLDSLADNNRAYLVDGAIAAAPAVEALLGEAA